MAGKQEQIRLVSSLCSFESVSETEKNKYPARPFVMSEK